MTPSQIVQQRLRNQRLTGSDLRQPAGVVSWLGAVQAQDYPAAKWGIGLRAKGVEDGHVEQAFNRGALLRTHILRPTWHFVAPGDIRWMLALSAPRLHAVNAPYYRKFEVDRAVVARTRVLLERALRDHQMRTRDELASEFEHAGIAADALRLAYLMMHAELDAVVCSGPRQGKQFTYALFDDRVPPAPSMGRTEALATLARRYFTSRGPATVHDFAWWSGLTVGEARIGLEEAKAGLQQETIGGRQHWFVEPKAPIRSKARSVYLLPNYDEFGIAYKDRSAMASLPRPRGLAAGQEFAHLLLVDRQLVGRWKRTVRPAGTQIEVQPFRRLTRDETRRVAAEAERYGRFANVPVTLAVHARMSASGRGAR